MRILLTIAWAVLAALLCWRAFGYKAPEIEQDILARTSEAVKAVNPNADVVVDGRFVTIRGPEPDEAAKSKTLAAADGVWGALGPYDGLWVPAAAKAIEFYSAEKRSDGKLVISGSAPNDGALVELLNAAKASFPGEIESEVEVGKSDGASAIPGIGDALKSLSTLDAGSLVATAGKLRLFGSTSDQAVADAAAALQSATPDLWQVVVKGPAPVLPEAPGRLGIAKTPAGSIIASGEIADEADRAALLDAFRAGSPDASITDRLVVRPEGLGDQWVGRAVAGAQALAALDWGNLSLEGDKTYLSGMAPADRIAAIAGPLGDGVDAAIDERPADLNAERIADLEARAAALADELAAARQRLADLEKNGEGLNADLAEARARIEELEKNLQAALAERDAAIARADELQKTADGLNADLAAAKARIEELEKNLAAAIAERDAAIARADGLQKTIDGLNGQIADAGKKIEELAGQLAAKPAPAVEPATPPAAAPANQAAATCNTEVANVLQGASIQFDTGKATLTAYGAGIIDRVMAVARPCLDTPGLHIDIGGHTDSQGDDDKNMRLSQDRAVTVKAALVQRGVNNDIITATGYGETQPIADNSTPEGRQANRRITMNWSVR